MGTPDSLLIFCPDHHRFYERYSYQLPDEVKAKLTELYPPLHEHLPRIAQDVNERKYLYFDGEGDLLTEDEYNSRDVKDEPGLKSFYGEVLTNVSIHSVENPKDVVYTGECPEIAAELCLFLGGRLQVKPGAHKKYSGYRTKPSNCAIWRRNSGNSDAEDNADVLAEHGCICREDEDGGYAIYHSPKTLAAAAKGQRTRAARAQMKGSSNGKVRQINYLYIEEIWDTSKVFANMLSAELDGFTTSGELEYRRAVSRGKAVTALRTSLEMFNFVFGKNMHRRIPAFQALLKLWQSHGEATRNTWGPGYGWREPFKELWDLLDREAKVKRPRSSLMGQESVKRAAHNRVDGLWRCPEEEAEESDDLD